MKVLVIGAGAVGGYYGSRLSGAGHDVTLVARGAHGRKIREEGLEIVAPEGNEVVKPRVIESVDEAANMGADVVLVCVKMRDLSGVAKGAGAALGPDGFAVPLQNGLDSEAELAAIIGAARVVGGIAQIASEIVGPGRVLVRAHGRLAFAPLQPAQQAATERLARAFTEAGVECRVVSDLALMLWTKMLWNAPFNAMCALTGLPAGGVLATPAAAERVRAAMAEVRAVAEADGVTIQEQAIDMMIAATERDFSDTVPSMLQDVRARRPTEADALQGAVVQRAERAGIEVPVLRTLWALLRAIDDSLARTP